MFAVIRLRESTPDCVAEPYAWLLAKSGEKLLEGLTRAGEDRLVQEIKSLEFMPKSGKVKLQGDAWLLVD